MVRVIPLDIPILKNQLDALTGIQGETTNILISFAQKRDEL